MVKYCTICGIPIYGRARKYCPECKRKVYLNQMNDYYIEHTNRYQYGGVYYKNRKGIQLCGTGSLGNKMAENFDKELETVEKEMLNLGLRKPIK